MDKAVVDKAIFDKYIEPTRKKREKCIGIEIEMPIIDLGGKPVEESIVIKMADAFREEFGFKAVGRDADGNVNSMADEITGDDLSFDCAYSNLELSMGKADDLFKVKERFERYYSFINRYFSPYGYTLTGMGINPNYNINYNKPIPNERYRMLYHFLHSYKSHKGEGSEVLFFNRPDFGTFTSASQVQIDVDHDELIDVINTFGRLEPYKALLFANSYLPEKPELLCSRNMLWEHSMQGYNPHNIGMFEHELKSVDDLVEYIKSQSIYCTMRDGRYIDFTPVPVEQFMQTDKITGEYFDGEKYCETEFTPCIEDLEYLRTFKFEDLTFRGTIEFRSSCCQPVSDSMTVAAFHIGLLADVPALKALLKSDTAIYSHGYSASELQKLLSKRELPEFIDKQELKNELKAILALASKGLEKRGLGEEKLLLPLYERAAALENPAKRMIEGLEKGESINKYILEYSKV